jgi:hypothetical protein
VAVAVVALALVAASCSDDPVRGSVTLGGEASSSSQATSTSTSSAPVEACDTEVETACEPEDGGLFDPAGTPGVDPAAALEAGCANVVGVRVEPTGDTFRFDVTVRSADTGPEKYADAWEVRGPDGEVLGVRELLHDHVTEQPFTRSLNDVEIPEEVGEVTVAARDSVVGFCGQVAAVEVPGR